MDEKNPEARAVAGSCTLVQQNSICQENECVASCITSHERIVERTCVAVLEIERHFLMHTM